MPVPPTRGHLPCRDTFAWIQKGPLKAGTTVLLTEVKYKEMENQKENADIFIGQAAKKFLYANKEQLNVPTL